MAVEITELTAGQHDSIPELIQPYSAFPKKIEGPTVWDATEYAKDPTKWKRRWTPELIAGLEEAYSKFEKSGLDITSITKETFPLPANVTAFLKEIRSLIIDGQGFILIQGLPTTEWSVLKSSAIYLAIGTIIGYVLSQNGKGHVLGHVKDLGNDPTQIHKVRIYSTNARQYFHTDAADAVGLLCLHRAKEGGESDVVSAHAVWNALQAERPDVAELLVKDNWYFDRKGEVTEGLNGWVKRSVFYLHEGRVSSHFDPYFVRSIGRHVEAGLIPGHSKEQLEAIEVLEQTAQKLALHCILEVGDIQFVADTHVFHARTAYTDYLSPAPRRHLLRLWLSVPVSEGGWARPFPFDDRKKRGGIQVGNQRETCPLDGE
ncbi:Clavaminate synthase-like protein [Meredithblackwellia eburnea MCA 4105]